MANTIDLSCTNEFNVTVYDMNHTEIPEKFFDVDGYGDEITIQLKCVKHIDLFKELFKEAELKGEQYVDFLNEVKLKLELLGQYAE